MFANSGHLSLQRCTVVFTRSFVAQTTCASPNGRCVMALITAVTDLMNWPAQLPPMVVTPLSSSVPTGSVLLMRLCATGKMIVKTLLMRSIVVSTIDASLRDKMISWQCDGMWMRNAIPIHTLVRDDGMSRYVLPCAHAFYKKLCGEVKTMSLNRVACFHRIAAWLTPQSEPNSRSVR